ncbi:(5-formylfuran-3-yl)methyl phosphate synthase [Ideonella sp. DXS29W]|uniref:(5-formylfuran-3-yl)methyl phosphate synthase n=1 Tax=Ideonella lacteola TaxID=2984193 RepID=A0ABU9BIA6_9BURK
MKLLVSVRDADEAVLAAAGGVSFIDLKEPGQGALGGLPIDTIRHIVGVLRQRSSRLPISATIGDVPMQRLDEIRARVQAVGSCGVDYVKVGIDPSHMGDARRALALLAGLAGEGLAIVPVFLADRGLDVDLLQHPGRGHWAGVMADTADKRAGSLLDVVARAALARFVSASRHAGLMVGLAGALRASDAAALAQLAPDFAGFRTAVCRGDRAGALDAGRLRELVQAMGEAERMAAAA